MRIMWKTMWKTWKNHVQNYDKNVEKYVDMWIMTKYSAKVFVFSTKNREVKSPQKKLILHNDKIGGCLK